MYSKIYIFYLKFYHYHYLGFRATRLLANLEYGYSVVIFKNVAITPPYLFFTYFTFPFILFHNCEVK